MPGKPGPRPTGGASHDSHSNRLVPADTPYDRINSLPMTTGTVGAKTYGSSETIGERSTVR